MFSMADGGLFHQITAPQPTLIKVFTSGGVLITRYVNQK